MDYKLMSNAGTWMVGRLQTERDKLRIIEALRSASGEVDVGRWDDRIGGLGKRQFVLKTARSPEPSLFTTRWAVSYLRGPLTRAELLRLKDQAGGDQEALPAAEESAAARAGMPTPGLASEPAPGEVVEPEPTPPGGEPLGPGVSSKAPTTPSPTRPTSSLAPDESPVPPKVASGVSVRFLDPGAPWARDLGVAPGGIRLEAGLAARVRVLFDDRRGSLRHEEEWESVFFPLGESLEPENARIVDHDPRDFRDDQPKGAVYALPEAPLDEADYFRSCESAMEDHLYLHRTLTLLHNPSLKLYSRVGESRGDFRARCLEAAEKEADSDAEKLRDRYENRFQTARGRRADAERRVRELEVDTEQRRQQELIAGAGEVLSMFLGGRRRTRSLSGIASRRSRTRRTRERLRTAMEKLQDYEHVIEELEDELSSDLEEIWNKWQDRAQEIETFEVGLEKSDIHLKDLVLFWAPVG
jgi:hypothetical protein